MSIKEIELVSFRNHERIKLGFGLGLNVIWGENGTGKTAVIEAIHLLSIGRSFRTSKSGDLLKDGDEYLQVTGLFEKKKKQEIVQMNQIRSGARSFIINGVKLDKVKQLIGKNTAVLLSPEEQIITNGSPADRRVFFDKLFSVISSHYLEALTTYTRTLKQRNRAVLEFRDKRTTNMTVNVWNEKLAESGISVWKMRNQLVKEFSASLSRVMAQYEGKEAYSCHYKSNAYDSVERYCSALEKRLSQDMVIGRTDIGPHRDVYIFLFNNKDLRNYGSQGEHKLALLLIKLAELDIIRKHTKTMPTLLLDDLFSKLDNQRSRKILELLNDSVQMIITTTDLIDIERRGINLIGADNRQFHLEKV